jgi:hypothetical protein
MLALYLALEFTMPYTPDQFLNSNIIDQIEPEIKVFVGGLAGIASFKFLIYRR